MDFTVSKHALERAVDMALTPEQIRAVVLNPDVRHWDEHSGNKPGWIHRSGSGKSCIAAVVDEEGGRRYVRTFLPGSRDAWEVEARLPQSPGRDASRYLNS